MSAKNYIAPLKTLLRGDPQELASLLRQPVTLKLIAPYVMALVLGCGAYGAAIGLWRAPLQGLFVGIKMPMLIALTLLVNGLINGMLAQVLGSGLSFKQTLTSFLMCFGLFGMIVGSLSPIVIAMVLDSPPPGAPQADSWYRLFLLTHTGVIAFAGIIANHKLLRLIQAFAGNVDIGRRTLIAWLAGNLFVGAQLSYILRPFFGNPDLPVEFLRSDPFNGNFYQAVFSMLQASVGTEFLRLISTIAAVFIILCILLSPFALLYFFIRFVRRQITPPNKP